MRRRLPPFLWYIRIIPEIPCFTQAAGGGLAAAGNFVIWYYSA
jgi:hypothetical protein